MNTKRDVKEDEESCELRDVDVDLERFAVFIDIPENR